MERKFKKSDTLDLIQGLWDGKLKRDQSEHKIIGFSLDAKAEVVKIQYNFLSPQGNIIADETRTLTVDLSTVGPEYLNKFNSVYNFLTDKTPELELQLNGVEIA